MPTQAKATPTPADEPAQDPAAEMETHPAQAQNPETPEPERALEPLPPWPHWRYAGPAGRAYTALPVTPEPDDIVAWPEPPSTDGCWEQVDDAVTRLPDNHPDTIAAAEAALLEASKEG